MSTRPKPCEPPILSSVSTSSTGPIASPSSDTGMPASKPTTTSTGFVGSILGMDGEHVGVVRSGRPGILQLSALDGPAPQVLVDGVGVLLGERQVDAALGQVVQELRPGHVPLAGGTQHGDGGVQAADRHIDPHLVVALGGAAVSDELRPALVGQLHHLLGDERPGQSGVERVLALIESVGLEGREGEVGEELLLGVDDDRVDRAGGESPLAQALEVLHPADVHQGGDDLVAELLLHVRDRGPRCPARPNRRVRTVPSPSVSASQLL